MCINNNILDALITAGLSENCEITEQTETMLATMTEKDWTELWRCAELHQIWGVVSAGLDKFGVKDIPREIREKFQNAKIQLSLQYYTLLSFTTYVLSLLKNAGISAYVLKGISLNSLYPSEEMRKLADADIYIPDRKAFGRAECILREKGFESEKGLAEFHSGWTKKMGNKICLLELHWRPCDFLSDSASEKAIRDIYSELSYRPDCYLAAGQKILVLPPAENALQLLLHMAQHFVNAGFGLRMLCDWSVFWRKKSGDVETEVFLRYLEDTGLTGFAWTVTQLCVRHMGLPYKCVPWLEEINGEEYKGSEEKLYRDIIEGGEFGRGVNSRVVILKGSSNILKSYVYEVHRVMRKRFPRLRKLVIVWPVLWTVTIAIFLRNNRGLGRGKTSDVIKSAKQRNALMKQMKMFE